MLRSKFKTSPVPQGGRCSAPGVTSGTAIADFLGSSLLHDSTDKYLDIKVGDKLFLERVENGWGFGSVRLKRFSNVQGWFPAGFWKSADGMAWYECPMAWRGERTPSVEASVVESRLCRVPAPQAVSTPCLGQTTPGTNGCFWQFQALDDTWCSMPADTVVSLHEAYIRFRGGASPTCRLFSGGGNYEFNFQTMEQINVVSRACRKIRWKYEIPPHWQLDDSGLMERQLQLQLSGPMPLGGFVPGEVVYTQDGRRGSVTKLGNAPLVRVALDPDVDGPAEVTDFDAGDLTLVGPRVAGGFRVGQTVYVKTRDKYAAYWPADVNSRCMSTTHRWPADVPPILMATHLHDAALPYGACGVVHKASKQEPPSHVVILLADAVVAADSLISKIHVKRSEATRPCCLITVEARLLSAYKLGPERPALGSPYSKGQIVFGLDRLACTICSNGDACSRDKVFFPAGTMYEILDIEFACNLKQMKLRPLECLDLVPPGETALVDISHISYTKSCVTQEPPALQGGFFRNQEVVWWSDDSPWRGIVKGLPSDGSPDHVSVSFCGGFEYDCHVDRLTSTTHAKPRRVLERIDSADDLMRIEALLRASIYHHGDHSGGCICERVKGLKVKAVWHVENWPLWRSYLECRHQMENDLRANCIVPRQIEPPLVAPLLSFASEIGATCNAINECVLFHGTSPEIAQQIATAGFDDRVSNACYYGRGTYFTPQICKSHQYTRPRGGVHTVIISRVAIGEPYFATQVDYDMRRPPFGASPARPCDSVIAKPGRMTGHRNGSQTHQELVIFERAQAYPEYIVEYAM